MNKPKWIELTEDESTNPPFDEKILTIDSFGRYVVMTAREGDVYEDGIDMYDEYEQLVDELDIEKWVLLSDILPKEEK